MSLTQMYCKRIIYNSKKKNNINIINKNKINDKKFCTYQPKNQGPEDPNVLLMFIIAVTLYSIDKIAGTKKR